MSCTSKRDYNCMCYDKNEDCYWACCKEYYNMLFKLDKCYNEINCICINKNAGIYGEIISITFDYKESCFILIIDNKVIKIAKANWTVVVLYQSPDLWLCKVKYKEPGFILTALERQCQVIKIFNDYNDLCNCCYMKKCDKCCGSSCNDIIESIALEETGIAHILNAEGEKLQKGIEIAHNINDLLCLNKSVSKTIKDITSLELALYLKLTSL